MNCNNGATKIQIRSVRDNQIRKPNYGALIRLGESSEVTQTDGKGCLKCVYLFFNNSSIDNIFTRHSDAVFLLLTTTLT